MNKRLAYYFGWGHYVGRDIEKLVCWIIGKAHWEGTRIKYNKDIEDMLEMREW